MRVLVGSYVQSVIKLLNFAGTLHNLLVSVSGVIYNMAVRMKLIPATDKYSSDESGPNKNGTYTSSSSGSSAEEDEQVIGECAL